eukprot:jgi/Botrbrau1/20399/Bobra.0006s0059.1
MDPTEVGLGHMRRTVSCTLAEPSGRYLYSGTETGDILQINLSANLLRKSGPGKRLVEGGVSSLCHVPGMPLLLVGGGAGTLLLLQTESVEVGGGDPRDSRKLLSKARINIPGGVTSVVVDAASSSKRGLLHFFCGTTLSEIHRISLDTQTLTLSSQLFRTAHAFAIKAIAFPHDYSEVFVTGSKGEIRVWHHNKRETLVRISVPGTSCHCVAVTQDGRAIVSGWEDGRVRAHGPRQRAKSCWTNSGRASGARQQPGRHFRLPSTDKRGARTVLCASGRLGSASRSLEASMKEHRGMVTRIKLWPGGDEECVSSSSDGSCIVWDLTHLSPRQQPHGRNRRDRRYLPPRGWRSHHSRDGPSDWILGCGGWAADPLHSMRPDPSMTLSTRAVLDLSDAEMLGVLEALGPRGRPGRKRQCLSRDGRPDHHVGQAPGGASSPLPQGDVAAAA